MRSRKVRRDGSVAYSIEAHRGAGHFHALGVVVVGDEGLASCALDVLDRQALCLDRGHGCLSCDWGK